MALKWAFSLRISGTERTSPLSCPAEVSPSLHQHVEIRAGGHGIQPASVFHQAPIPGLRVAELAFDNAKSVLHFASYRGFVLFDQALPINRVIGSLGQAVRTAVDAGINLGHIILNLRAFGDPQIAVITVNGLVILSDEFSRRGYVIFIGGSHFYGVNQSAARVDADVALHVKAPFIAFLRLMNLMVVCFFPHSSWNWAR